MADDETTERILEVLRDAEEPLSASQVQHRLASRSRDVTTGVIRDVCKVLVEGGRAEATDDLPPAYRLVDEPDYDEPDHDEPE
jgi:repressor of nif and glnA expression